MRNPRNDPLGSPKTGNADSPLRHARDEREGSERRCVLTGENGSRSEFVRLVASPDGQVLPDALAKAPGRGAWIGVSRDRLEVAMADGKLRGALARAFKTGNLSIPEDLPQRTHDALEKALVQRLGLEMRAGRIILGSDRIAEQARMGRVAALYHAADASDDGRRKLDQAWRVGLDEEGSGKRGTVLPLDREALSVALGRDNVVHLALADVKSAERVRSPLARLQTFLGAAPAAGSSEDVGGAAAADV